MSTSALGAIAAGSYAAYLAGSIAVGVLAGRVGLRWLVLVCGAAAVAGMTLAGLSTGPGLLVAGVLVAGVSAAFALPPFIDAAQAYVAPERRARTLASISSGTGWGVALAAPLAIVAGGAWRGAWLAFAAVGVARHGVGACACSRAAAAAAAACALPRLRLGWFVCPRSGPLLAGALLVGLGASLYWTFAVDFLVDRRRARPSGGRLLLVVVGVASVLGTGAGELVERLGSRAAFALLSWALGLSLALLALAPGAPVLAVVSGVLFGSAYNLGRRDPDALERAGVRRAAGHRRRRGHVHPRRRAADRAARGGAAHRRGRHGGRLRGRSGPARAHRAARAARAGDGRGTRPSRRGAGRSRAP